jgi:ADP-ribosylglycohydrolase
MLIDLAIGDAYGAGFEFAPDDLVRKYNNLSCYLPHALGDVPGRYTDDTQMSIALAILLIEEKDWSPINIANSFVNCFKRDERIGYSKGFYDFLRSVKSGNQFLKKIDAVSIRNGACMRAAPIGVLNNIAQILEYAEIQARVTHNTESGILSSQAIALCSHYFLHSLGSKSELTQFINEHTNKSWDNNWSQPVPCSGLETVNAVITVLEKSSCLRSVLINSVALTGDVDTVAAVSFGIASQNEQYRDNLPPFLYEDLEDGEFGKEYLSTISKKLLNLRS